MTGTTRSRSGPSPGAGRSPLPGAVSQLAVPDRRTLRWLRRTVFPGRRESASLPTRKSKFLSPRGSSRTSAARVVFVRRRRIVIPATIRPWAVFNAGGKGAGSNSASARSASSMRPIRRRRRTSRYRAYAALTRSPCSSSVARAASSAFAGQPSSRETSAISASATTHRTGCRGGASPPALSRRSLEGGGRQRGRPYGTRRRGEARAMVSRRPCGVFERGGRPRGPPMRADPTRRPSELLLSGESRLDDRRNPPAG
jgi:hypothetical protein